MQGRILANRYLLAEPIGAGGMGTVYRATDLRTGGTVAVKLLHPMLVAASGYTARLRREAQLAASLTSPRVVRVIDLDTDDGAPFLVMEFVSGQTLEQLIEDNGALPERKALGIALEVTHALEAAHAAGIVHRDLKPQNIKLVDGQVKVLDFGIARGEGGGPTMTGDYLGTPEYSAPELLEGRGDARTDIYALGVLLFRLVEGHLPFTGPTPLAVLNQQATQPLPPLTRAGPATADIIRRCTEKRPEDRFQTATDVSSAMQGALAAQDDPEPARVGAEATIPAGVESVAAAPTTGTRVPSASMAQRTRPPVAGGASARRRLALVGGGVLLAGAIVLAAFVVWSRREGDDARDTGGRLRGAASSQVGWLLAGRALTDSGGAWRFKETVNRDLIAEGFIRTRVIGGECGASPDEVVAFEGTVPPEKVGDSLWEVIIQPGKQALSNPRTRTSGAAFLRQEPGGRTGVEIALDDLPPRRPFNVCFSKQ